MSVLEDRSDRWSDSCLALVKAISIILLIACLVYLAVAGMNYAVLGAVFFEGEHAGTIVTIVYALVLFAMALAASLLGLRASYEPSRIDPFCIAASVLVAGVLAGVVSGNFGYPDSAFGSGLVGGLNLFFGVIALVGAGIGIFVIRPEVKPAASRPDADAAAADSSEGPDAAEGEADAADESGQAAVSGEADDADGEAASDGEADGAEPAGEEPAEDASEDADRSDDEDSAAAADEDDASAEADGASEDDAVADESADGETDEGVEEVAEPTEAEADEPEVADEPGPIAEDEADMEFGSTGEPEVDVESDGATEEQVEEDVADSAEPVVAEPSDADAAAEASVPHTELDEIEWVDFGADPAAAAEADDEPGFFGKHLRRH